MSKPPDNAQPIRVAGENYRSIDSNLTGMRRKSPHANNETTFTHSELPATAVEGRFVEAMIGLEKAKQPAAAVDGYRAALSRWPHNLSAMVGLGNSYYGLGDLKNSETAFRQATEAHPREGAAFNNLADVLLRQGLKSKALDAARKAITLGGMGEDTFQKTLEEIQAAGP